MFLLDTDHLVIIQRRSQPEYNRLVARIQQHSLSDFFIAVVSFHEQTLGAHTYISKARRPAGVLRGYQMFQELLLHYGSAQVLPFDQAASDRFDALRQQRVRIATMDLRIAAIALCHHFTVLTRNLGDFRQVPGLAVEDWTA